jgi:hypothetical protein
MMLVDSIPPMNGMLTSWNRTQLGVNQSKPRTNAVGATHHEDNVVNMPLDSLDSQCTVLDNLDLVARALQKLDSHLLIDDICAHRMFLVSKSDSRPRG